MKLTIVFIGLLALAAAKTETKDEEPKDKREAPVAYGGGSGNTAHIMQIQQYQPETSAVSIGAGYNIGGDKQASQGYNLLSADQGHGAGQTISLPPITLQPQSGNEFALLMSSLGAHGLTSGSGHFANAGLIGLTQPASYPGLGGHQFILPQASYQSAKLAPLSYSSHSSAPAYASGTHGLGAYATGGYATGPVLFSPAHAGGHSYTAPTSFAASSHTPSYYSSAGAALAASDASPSYGGHSFPTFQSSKELLGSHGFPSTAAFKPSAFLGASVSSGSHGSSGLSGLPSYLQQATHSFPVHGSSHGSGESQAYSGHGASKVFGSAYLAPSQSHGLSSLGGHSYSSLGSLANYVPSSHSSPPSASYGHPSAGSYTQSSSAHASQSSPQYYIASSHPSSHRYTSVSEPAKYSSYPKDSHGANSESLYNTIKYSTELKPMKTSIKHQNQ